MEGTLMYRRDFLKQTVAAGVAANFLPWGFTDMPQQPIPRRRYAGDIDLSIIGFGAIVLMGMEQHDANRIVAEMVDRGINYFDVAPSYGGGEAETKLGPALEPHRKNVFLACKTMNRDAKGAREELERSLTRLRTDHLDLYQFHAVTRMDEVEQIFGPDGALETFVEARKEGKVRHLGFSAHSEEAALAMLDRFHFDSILFPTNFVCFTSGHFGPRVIAHAKEKGTARLALKAMAYTPWPQGEEQTYPKCWYKPVSDPDLAGLALRFTLSEDITAAIPPGDERLYRIALKAAGEFLPLSVAERKQLVERAQKLEPLFKTQG
jgi:predicted aldo/keto reductase-like oxidoreductase